MAIWIRYACQRRIYLIPTLPTLTWKNGKRNQLYALLIPQESLDRGVRANLLLEGKLDKYLSLHSSLALSISWQIYNKVYTFFYFFPFLFWLAAFYSYLQERYTWQIVVIMIYVLTYLPYTQARVLHGIMWSQAHGKQKTIVISWFSTTNWISNLENAVASRKRKDAHGAQMRKSKIEVYSNGRSIICISFFTNFHALSILHLYCFPQKNHIYKRP